MKIKEFSAKNFRTLEDISIKFNSYYTAISGKNNSGKSNILKAIRCILGTGVSIRILSEEIFGVGNLSYKNDYTNWKLQDKDKTPVQIKLILELNKNNDASVYRFITDLILKESSSSSFTEDELLTIERIDTHENKTTYNLTFGNEIIKDDFQKGEILRRIKTSDSIIFHNSTQNEGFPFASRNRDSVNNFIGDNDREQISSKMNDVLRSVQKALKHQQEELSHLLGRLEEKYDVSLSISGLNLDRESIDISLKEKGFDVSLDDWGSGTKNRTRIFLSILNARKAQKNPSDSERLTPIVIIEEPESFLHPSAQAEFGRVLQALSTELQIQVIVATHSPYLLSHKEPESNILIDRDLSKKSKNKGSILIDTSSDKWFEPFALSLGINGEDFGPLKNTVFNEASEIILVEGATDVEYFKILTDERHGKNRLNFDGEIYSYNGTGNIKNNVLVRFIKNRYSKFIISVDFDQFAEVKKSLESIGIEENKSLVKIGLNQNGKKCIEGLLPQKVVTNVFTQYPDLVQAAMENSSDKKEAQNQLKMKYLEEFKNGMEFTNEYFGEFYKLSEKLNKMLK